MSRRPPPPSLPEVDEVEAYRVFHATCGKKKRCPSIGHARGDAAALKRTTGEVVEPYRCPFSSLVGEAHYHNGHPPGIEAMARLAAVVRWFGVHGFDPERAP